MLTLVSDDCLSNVEVILRVHLTDQVDKCLHFVIALGVDRKQSLLELGTEHQTEALILSREYLEDAKGSLGLTREVPVVKLCKVIALVRLCDDSLDRVNEQLEELAVWQGEHTGSLQKFLNPAMSALRVGLASCLDSTFENFLRDLHTEQDLEDAQDDLANEGVTFDEKFDEDLDLCWDQVLLNQREDQRTLFGDAHELFKLHHKAELGCH